METTRRMEIIGDFEIHWEPEEEMFPELGYAIKGVAPWCAYIREGLPPLVEKGVIAHELQYPQGCCSAFREMLL